MGLSLSSILLIYTGASVARAFFITAAAFGSLSLYGYTTKRDLGPVGSFMIMGLFGVIIASLVNLFLQSPAMQYGLSMLSVLIFAGLTAYDTQAIKSMYLESDGYRGRHQEVGERGADALPRFHQHLHVVGPAYRSAERLGARQSTLLKSKATARSPWLFSWEKFPSDI